MKIMTKPFGEIEVNEKQKIHFPDGLFGFEEVKHYFLLDSEEGPFYWLQSAEHPDLAFVLIDPRVFKDNYVLDLREEDYKAIKAKKGDVIDFTIVTVPEDPEKISANLMGPIIIASTVPCASCWGMSSRRMIRKMMSGAPPMPV